MDVYNPDTGLFTKSTDEYVQFLYTYGQLYFQVYAKDEGETIDELVRDHVRFTVFFPDGSEAFYYYDCDDWYEAAAGAWVRPGRNRRGGGGHERRPAGQLQLQVCV